MSALFKTATTRRFASCVMALCLLFGLVVGHLPGLVPSVSAANYYDGTTEHAYQIQFAHKSNGDSTPPYYYLGFDTEIGKTYEFKAYYAHMSGPGMNFRFDTGTNKQFLLYGTRLNEELEGVSYDPDTLEVKYTFKAINTVAWIHLFAANKGDNNTIAIANPTLTDTATGEVFTMEGKEWLPGATWNMWPNSCTAIDGIAKPVGAVQINLAYKNDATDGRGCDYSLGLSAVAGAKYTFKANYLPKDGPGFELSIEDGSKTYVLMNGGTVNPDLNGVTYDAALKEVAFSFTAESGTPKVRLKSVNKGDNNTAQIGEVRLIDNETFETITPAPGSNWELGVSYNAWPFGVTEIEKVEGSGMSSGGIADPNVNKMFKLDVFSGAHSTRSAKVTVEPGKTYTYTFYWRAMAGNNVRAYLNTKAEKIDLMVGNTPSEGVAYDPTTGLVTYTFAAAENDAVEIGVGANKKNVPSLAYFGAPTMTAQDGTVAPIMALKRWTVYDYPANACDYAVTDLVMGLFANPQYEGLASLTVEGLEIGFDPQQTVYEVTVPHNFGALNLSFELGKDAKNGANVTVHNNVRHAEGTQEAVSLRVPLKNGETQEYTIYVNTMNDPERVVTMVYVREYNQAGYAWFDMKAKPNVTYAFDFLYKDIAGGKVEVGMTGSGMPNGKTFFTKDGKPTDGVDFNPDTGRFTYVFTPRAEDLEILVNFNNHGTNNTILKFEAYVADFRLYEVDENGNAVPGGHSVAIDNTFSVDDLNTDEVEGEWKKTTYGGNFWNVMEGERVQFVHEYERSLSGLVIDGVAVEKFHPATTVYFVSVPYTQDSISIVPTLGEDGSSFVMSDTTGLVEGENVVHILVNNNDGTQTEYLITVTKQEEPDAYLNELRVTDGTLSPEFKAGVFEYTATVPFAVTEAAFEYALSENGTLVSIEGGKDLKVGIPAEVIITVKNGKGVLTAYKITVTREGKESEAAAMQDMVNKALAEIMIDDYTTKDDLAAMLTAAIDNDAYTLAVVDFYRLRSVTEVKDSFEVLIEGKPGYLAAVVNVSDGESLAQVTVSKLVPFATKEYTYTEDEVSTEDDFIMSEGVDGWVVDFYVGDAKKVVIPDYVVELAYGWLDAENIEEYEVLVIPDSVKVLPADMLFGSYGLETVVFGDGLTDLATGVCAKLPNLQYVRLPEGLERVNEFAFDCTPSLASIRLPEGLKEIGPSAFCFTLMREVTVPASVVYIGEGAFAHSFAAAVQLFTGSDNTRRWYPFAAADDPRIAIIQARCDKEVDWRGTKPSSPVWDTVAEAQAAAFGVGGLYGALTASRKTVTVLNPNCEYGPDVFNGQGIWCGAGNVISIPQGATAEEMLRTEMEKLNASHNSRFADVNPVQWGTCDMTLAEVAARTMFALDKIVIGGTTTEDDLLATVAKEYFTSQVTAEIADFAIDAAAGKASGTFTLKQGNVSLAIAIDKDVDVDYVPDDGDDFLIRITDGKVVALTDGKATVANGATLEAVMAALAIGDGVEVDFYDEYGDYISPKYYGIAVIRNGFVMDILKDGEKAESYTFVFEKTDAPEAPEDGGNVGTGVTSVAVTMLLLMAGAAVTAAVLYRRKETC